MAMHIDYEDVEPWPVERIDTPDPKRTANTHPKPVLKSHSDKGLVVVSGCDGFYLSRTVMPE